MSKWVSMYFLRGLNWPLEWSFDFIPTLKYVHFWYPLAPALNSIYCIGSYFRSSSKTLHLCCCCLVQNLVKCFLVLWHPPKFLYVTAVPSLRIPEALLSVTSSALVQPPQSSAHCFPYFPSFRSSCMQFPKLSPCSSFLALWLIVLPLFSWPGIKWY